MRTVCAGLLRALLVVGCAALLGLVGLGTATPAWAHAVGGVEPSNYRVTVTALSPSAPGVGIEVGTGGQWVRVTNHGAGVVTVTGYRGEPFLRVARGRVMVNRHATPLVDNRKLSPGTRGEPNPAAAPRWVPVREGTRVTWTDARLTGGGDGRTGRVGTWTLPLRVNGQAVTVTGTWQRVPPPSPWPWVAGLVVLTAAVAVIGWLRRWQPWAATVLALAGAANAAHLVGAGLAARPGSAVSVWGSVVGLGLLYVPLVAVGVVTACRRGPHAAFAVTIAAVVLAVVAGPGDLGVLWHSQLAFAWHPAVERALVVGTLAGTAGLVVAGIRILRATPGGDPDHDPGPGPGAVTNRIDGHGSTALRAVEDEP